MIPLPSIDSPFQLNCKTIYTEITKDSINRACDKIQLSKDSALKKSQLKEAVIRNMRECWYMWGESQVKVQQAVDSSGTACVVCSEIIVDDEFKKANPDYTLDDMYGYAANTGIPPLNEKKYLDYFLESSTTKPDLSKIPKKDIILNKQYSIVFAITTQSERVGALFGGGGVIKPGTGIVDCYLGGYDKNPVTGDDAKDIGCNSRNNDPFQGLKAGENPGLIFGTVIDGGTDVDLLNLKNLVPGLGSGTTLHTYPATVRLVPSGNLSSNCARIY